jgi:putative ABC transport system permease protein
VGTQRDQIAVLKAFGYANRDIGFHYAKLVVAIALVGTAIGTAGGVWLGRNMARTYMEFYRFPFLEFALRPGDVAVAAAMSVAVALSGTFLGVRRAARLPPAEAMRPETPERYRKTFLGRIGVERLLSQPARMIARHIGRRPVKSLATVLGVSMACAILTTGRFQEDAMNFLMDVEFRQARQDDVAVAFFEPASRAALHELKSIGGVREAEPYRTVPVRLRNGHRTYRTALQGYEVDARLVRVLDAGMRRVGMPAAGVLLTDQLGKILGVRTGDRLTVEALEGSRPVRETTVAGLSRQYVGVSGYMEISALNRLMREGDAISGAYLAVEPGALPEVLRRIKGMPRVAGAAMRENEIRGFRETMAESMLVFTLIVTALAGTIAIGVVYNSARIALSERSRELASLRVLGYTRGEISYILLGELAVYTLAAIPPGFLVGRALCAYIVAKFETDLYRIPLVLEADTYGFAAAVVLASALLSGLAVRWRLDRLDLVAVLKTRE